MNLQFLRQPRSLLIGAAILIITVFSFIIRTIPAFSGNPDVMANVGMDDPTYHLRQIEQMMANFPQYAWFDPMTYYPLGQPMHWGPLFTLICTTVCILAGATTRPEIVSVSLFIPCVMGALLVPITYLLVWKIADWKAGLLAAFFIAIAPGQIFFRSYYGYLDHHIGEVLFGTLFCLCYIYALVYCRKNPVDINRRETWKMPALLGLLSGFIYFLGFAEMPTMMLFALLVGFFTPIWFLIQRYIGHLGASAVIVNTSLFLVAILGCFVVGFHTEGGLNYYTTGHPVVYALLILGTLVLFGFSYALRDRPFSHYVLSLIGFSVLGLVLLAFLLPGLFDYLMANANAFFGQEIHWKTIQEARPWTFSDAWNTFQWGLFLFFAGLLVLLHRLKKELCPSHVFVAIWSVVILYATMQHIRYEYYLAIPVSILGGIAISFALDLVLKVKKSREAAPVVQPPDQIKGGKQKDIHGQKQHKHSTKGPGIFLLGSSVVFLVGLLILGSMFTYGSLGRDLSIGSFNLNPDWREATGWLGENTPDPGVDYLKIYQADDWIPPSQSYGVMSWWDYGHIITYLAKRMPNANPFQYGVTGDYGAARFFIATNESLASGILDKLKTRYIITDYEMDTGKFWAMATWDNPDLGATPYQRTFILPNPDNPKTGSNFPFFMEPYYRTMVSRLHNFDGSLSEPGKVHFIQYMKPEFARTNDPLIVNGAEVNYTEGSALLEAFKPEENPEHEVALVNYVYTSPVSKVPALQHYRLIHESPTRASPEILPDIRYVKIFEYVPGAVIPGEGVIEIPVRTNVGRTFVYRQESSNGTFTVPYPTNTVIGDITTLGPYTISGTGKEVAITEDQIQQGSFVS
ncbi:MAG TPA: oligosaccharyl transferase, archaeosortase A system-associated [Methanospirillum sp.]|nr:oligosaccharyl transferase, archaeosortase A system-associated [Methanospirillum sp.]